MRHPKSANPDVSVPESSEIERSTPATEQPMLSSRARVGLLVLSFLSLVWISTLPRPAISRGEASTRLEGAPFSNDYRQPIDDLRLAALERDVSAFEPGRNIFAFDSKPMQRPSIGWKERRRITAQGGGSTRSPDPDPTPDATFLGVFGPEHLRLAVLKDKDGETVSNYREHDLIDDRYRVLSIDLGSILLRDLATPGASPIHLKLP